MDRSELKSLQGPLKESYREDPALAHITLTAAGSLDEGLSCSVTTGAALVAAGLHPATGGTGALACSGDMLLQALVACAGVTMQAVATSLGISVSGAITASGDLDFRGTLGVDKAVPVGFQRISLVFDVDTGDADQDSRNALLRLTERYCVVLQTLTTPLDVSARYADV